MVISFPCDDEAGKYYFHKNTSSDSKSVLLSITSTSSLVFRRSYIETVAQGELDAVGC